MYVKALRCLIKYQQGYSIFYIILFIHQGEVILHNTFYLSKGGNFKQ